MNLIEEQKPEQKDKTEQTYLTNKVENKNKVCILNLQADNYFLGRNLPEAWGYAQKRGNSQCEVIHYNQGR